MGRMHSGGKGISKSSLPYKRSPPSWLKISAQEVTEHVCKLAKKGLTPSQVRTRREIGLVGSLGRARLVLGWGRVIWVEGSVTPHIDGYKTCGTAGRRLLSAHRD